MRPTQVKILDALKKSAQAKGLDADVEYNFSNTGRIFFRKEFDTEANLYFDFQPDYFTIAFANGGTNAEYFGHNDKIFYVKSGNGSEIKSMLAFVSTRLGGK